jgi:hypothetical protein
MPVKNSLLVPDFLMRNPVDFLHMTFLSLMFLCEYYFVCKKCICPFKKLFEWYIYTLFEFAFFSLYSLAWALHNRSPERCMPDPQGESHDDV